MGLFQELKRRNVIRVAIAYMVTAWLVLQIADLVLANIGAPIWVMQTILLLLALGLPLAVVFAWAFEITPAGIKLERDIERSDSITHSTGRKLDYSIIAMLLVVAVYFFWESRFSASEPAPNPALAEVADRSAPANTALADERAADTDAPSIAVLPFVNLSSDPEQEFFSDGISEELLNVLAQFPDLRVAARTSSFQFKGDNRDIGEIARLLKVNHVLEGSVRKAGNQLRITAQLIEAENGYHLWSDTYDRTLEDVFAIQDEISAAIGDALRSQLRLDDTPGSGPRVTEAANTAAYEAYLHGRYLINQRGNKAITEAVQQLEKSVRLDPEFAPSRAQLAIAFTLLHNNPSTYGDLSTEEVNAKASPHIEKAFALTDTLAEAWGAKSMLAKTNDDSASAVRYAKRALELNPAYVDAMNWITTSALLIGDYNLAFQYLQSLLEVDPLSIIGRLNYAGTFLGYSDPEQAHRIADDLLTVSSWAGHATHANVSRMEGNLAEAVRWSLLAFRDNPLDNYSNEGLAAVLGEVELLAEALRVSDDTRSYAANTSEEFRAVLSDAEKAAAADPNNSHLLNNLAYVSYYAEDFDTAFTALKALHDHSTAALPASGGYNLIQTMHYAWLLRQAGEESAGATLLAKAQQDLDAKRDSPLALSPGYYRDRAMLAHLKNDDETALTTLRELKPHQLGPRQELLDPMLAPLFGDPRFEELLQRYETWVAQQRQQVLKLICLDNPIPDAWRPLQATCLELRPVALR